MKRIAFGCIEEQSTGQWVCLKAATIPGRFGPVEVRQGQTFNSNAAFAGYDDFTQHLANVSTVCEPGSVFEHND